MFDLVLSNGKEEYCNFSVIFRHYYGFFLIYFLFKSTNHRKFFWFPILLFVNAGEWTEAFNFRVAATSNKNLFKMTDFWFNQQRLTYLLLLRPQEWSFATSLTASWWPRWPSCLASAARRFFPSWLPCVTAGRFSRRWSPCLCSCCSPTGGESEDNQSAV